MREILFKAKRIENGEWVEGYYCKYGYTGKEKHYIIPDYASDLYAFKIDIDTLCQYTGLLDENGKKIWENDVIKFEDTGEDGYEYKEGFEFTNIAQVVFNNGRWELDKYLSENSYVFNTQDSHGEFCGFWNYAEVIGNIFDDPELLEE